MKITCSMCTAKLMIPCGSHSTQFESFLTMIGHRSGMMFEQCERAIGILTAGISAFPTPQINSKSTTERISANWERSGPTQVRQTT